MNHAVGGIENRECYQGIVYSEQLAGGVGIFKRVVKAIAVSVVALCEARKLNIVVRTEESAQQRVIQASVHVDDAELRQHLMSRIATVIPYQCQQPYGNDC